MKRRPSNNRLRSIEALEAKQLMTADLLGVGPADVHPTRGTAEIDFVEVAGAELEGQDGSDLLVVNNGDGSDFLESGRDYFLADSFSFGVEREMKESGEKGGTEDINIGVGELQECTTSKSIDSAAVDEAILAIADHADEGPV